MSATSIEWTDHSVNPIRARHKRTGAVGHYCEKVSSGCANCYSSAFQPRFHMPTFGGRRKLPQLRIVGNNGAVSVTDEIEVFLDESRLLEVLRRRTPTKFFWCDMTDLFGEWVPFEWIDRCLAVMALTPQHIHQVLTKRPELMAAHLTGDTRLNMAMRLHEAAKAMIGYHNPRRLAVNTGDLPLRNIWLGTSAERQQELDERLPHLRRCPAAVRFLSLEPLLGPVDIGRAVALATCRDIDAMLSGDRRWPIHWVIAGGESGPGARWCRVEWFRSLRDQCRAAGVAYFQKQMGSRCWEDRELEMVGRWGAPCANNILRTGRKGGDLDCIPEDLRVREFPTRPVAGEEVK